MLRNLLRMFQKYPKPSFLTGGVVCLPFVDLRLTFRAKRIRNARIDSTLEAGTPLLNFRIMLYINRVYKEEFIHSNMTLKALALF